MEDRAIKTLAKCFIHGVMFSLLFSMLAFAWFLGLIFLVAGMAFFGLLIGVAVLLPLVGVINRFLTEVIWETETSSSWKSLFLHGLALIVLIFAANIGVAFVIGLVFPGIYSMIISFLLSATVDGYIARYVSTLFPAETENRTSLL